MPDLTYATRTLLRAIQDLPEGTVISADSLREPFDAAHLTVAERGGAFQSALHHGWIRRDGWHPSTYGPRKCGSTHTWARTAKTIPDHVCVVELRQEAS